ncbi:MAG: agmatinase [Bacillota bacterium]
MDKLFEKYEGFIGSSPDPEAEIALVGAPMDFTVSFRSGARRGPQAIRAVSDGLEEYSVPLDRHLGELRYHDWGDIPLPFGNVKESLRRIRESIRWLVDQRKKVLVLGGEHLITFPVLEAMAEVYPGLAVIHFDAHADLRGDYLGEKLSHATVMRRAAQIVGGDNIYQLGIRSGTKEEFAYARKHTNLFLDQVLEPIPGILEKLQGRHVYITLDIDVVDPAFAPGTGTPEPGGCTSKEILEAIRRLGALSVVGMDLVEVQPTSDLSERTAILAAKLIRESLLAFFSSK